MFRYQKTKKHWILMAYHESGKPYLNLSKPWIPSFVSWKNVAGWNFPFLVSYYLKKSLVKVSSITINKNHPEWPYQKPIRNADRFFNAGVAFTPGEFFSNSKHRSTTSYRAKPQGPLIEQQNHPTWWNIGKNALKIGIWWNWWWLNQTFIKLVELGP